MKTPLLTSIAFAALLMGCDTADQSTASNLNTILGKTLTNDRGNLVIQSNGTGNGSFDGGTLMITWALEDGRFCREGSVGDQNIPRNCQTLVISGNMVSFINPDGGVSSTYTIS